MSEKLADALGASTSETVRERYEALKHTTGDAEIDWSAALSEYRSELPERSSDFERTLAMMQWTSIPESLVSPTDFHQYGFSSERRSEH
ncbi:hypothetical protein [Halorussus caseinilyticus]|uniref:hypothetical protein n=1 Tax=Halorussus caseinilyticus TaxID=3034025 RepID=UPI0023E766EF|nr:hypothetical protein [Halorussus sp. DT72]